MSTDTRARSPAEPKKTKDHHLEEWTSGQRGGGKVPEDFAWRTNPKQWQEELGTPQPSRKLDG
ncbi:MAG TPA: hypothetical protein VND93_27525 [Myxococcales bacterium]|jgi:hypothetical protein|nr:hypothetical protein [Myxococcales bacterium]